MTEDSKNIEKITVPLQLCPKCQGTGYVPGGFIGGQPFASSASLVVCNVCHGSKVIPMHSMGVKKDVALTDYCNFEFAKKIRLKGFNLPCETVYNGQGGVESAMDFIGQKVFTMEDLDSAAANGYEAYMRPTILQVIEWLATSD